MIDGNANTVIPRIPTEMDIALSMYSDLHKDVFGMRPVSLQFATLQDVEEAIHDLIPLLEEVETRREESENDAWMTYRQRIQKLANDLNIDQATAIRWDMEAENIDLNDIDFYCYLNDLSYDRANDIQEMLN